MKKLFQQLLGSLQKDEVKEIKINKVEDNKIELTIDGQYAGRFSLNNNDLTEEK